MSGRRKKRTVPPQLSSTQGKFFDAVVSHMCAAQVKMNSPRTWPSCLASASAESPLGNCVMIVRSLTGPTARRRAGQPTAEPTLSNKGNSSSQARMHAEVCDSVAASRVYSNSFSYDVGARKHRANRDAQPDRPSDRFDVARIVGRTHKVDAARRDAVLPLVPSLARQQKHRP